MSSVTFLWNDSEGFVGQIQFSGMINAWMCVAKPLKILSKNGTKFEKKPWNLRWIISWLRFPKLKKNEIRFIYSITTMEYNAALGLAQLIY